MSRNLLCLVMLSLLLAACGQEETTPTLVPEPTLFAAELRQLGVAEDYDTEQFNQDWREIALAMREVDSTIKLMGPELHGTYASNFESNPKDSSGRDWMVEFLKANSDLVDVVTFHRYPFPQGEQRVTIDDLRQNAKEWDLTIPYSLKTDKDF